MSAEYNVLSSCQYAFSHLCGVYYIALRQLAYELYLDYTLPVLAVEVDKVSDIISSLNLYIICIILGYIVS